jgi:hypothetical protein
MLHEKLPILEQFVVIFSVPPCFEHPAYFSSHALSLEFHGVHVESLLIWPSTNPLELKSVLVCSLRLPGIKQTNNIRSLFLHCF